MFLLDNRRITDQLWVSLRRSVDLLSKDACKQLPVVQQVSSKFASCTHWILLKLVSSCKSRVPVSQLKRAPTWVHQTLVVIRFKYHLQVYYNGVFDCAKKMVKAEGFFALYKGILPPILVETPKRAVKFLTFEQTKQFFMFGSDKPTPLVSFLQLQRIKMF